MKYLKILILVIPLFFLFAPSVSGLECTTNDHCPADQFCYNYQCRSPECQTDADCQSGYFCYLQMCYLEDNCRGGSCQADCRQAQPQCEGDPPEENCQCIATPVCNCLNYCERLYCGNVICSQWSSSCQSQWSCLSQTKPSPDCQCWNLNSDHPDPLRVQRGEALNFSAEVASLNSAPVIPSLNFTLKHNNQVVTRSGDLLAGFIRRETQNNIYQASWSWAVPNTPEAKGDYQLHLDFDCRQTSPQNFISLAKPVLPLFSLWKKILAFLGFASPQTETTLPPAFPPDQPTIIRPESGLTLQLGTFLLPLPENTCYDYYFRVIN